MTEDRTSQELDPEKIRAGSRTTHRTAVIITALGVFIYIAIAGLVGYRHALGVHHGPLIMTISADTTLAVLGVAATVLIAFVASLWTSLQSADPGEPARSGGRRLALVDVIAATGGGSVCVAVAGALDGWGENFNVIVSTALVGLGVALAYVAAEISEFIKRDQRLSQTLSQLAQHSEVNRMRNARRCWLKRTSLAGLRRPRHRWLARLRQNLGCVVAFALLLCVVRLVWRGTQDLAPMLAVAASCVVWSLIVGQFMAHHAAVCFVRRDWLPLMMVSLVSLVVLSANASLALGVALYSEQSLGMPSAAAHAFAWSTMFSPLLLCLVGLTVVPKGWRWYRPLTAIRWGVISAISRHTEKLSRDKSAEASGVRRGRTRGALHRLRTAIRTATGVEPLGPTP